MVRLSNKERYALQAIVDLAFLGDGPPAQVRDIAARQRIPLRFLEQIFQDLKRAGLVGSKRGPGGGYHLARPPTEIGVGDVIRATSGAVAPVTQRAQGRRRRAVDLNEVTDAVLHDLSRSVERCFDEVTIEHVCARGEQFGLVRARPRPGSPVRDAI